MNFFNANCQEPSINHKIFGLCDDENNQKAYTDIDDSSKWIAKVKNKNEIDLVFTAIDNCVIKNNEYLGRGRCDAMLTSTKHLYFIELKNVARRWINDAVEQLESTIQFFLDNHDIDVYRHKKAFVCNKKHSPF